MAMRRFICCLICLSLVSAIFLWCDYSALAAPSPSNPSASAKEDTMPTAATYSQRCLVHLQRSEEQAAIADCTAAIGFNPGQTEAYTNRGLAYYRLGNYRAALAQYQRAIEQAPRDFRVYYNQGLAYHALSDYGRAIAAYDSALDLLPTAEERAAIYNDRGLSDLMLNELSEAIADFGRAIRLDSSNERAYTNRACAYQHQRNYSAAVADFTRVLQLDAERAEAYVSRGWLYHRIGEEQAALWDLKVALHYFAQQGNAIAVQKTLALVAKLEVFIG